MHQADSRGEITEIALTHVVCLKCFKKCLAQSAKAMGDWSTGMTYGYWLVCEHCGEKTFLPYMGHPALFNISLEKLYSIWRIIEV